MRNHKSCKIAFLAFRAFENNDRRVKRAVEEEKLKNFTIQRRWNGIFLCFSAEERFSLLRTLS
jgi:hypothetical protein